MIDAPMQRNATQGLLISTLVQTNVVAPSTPHFQGRLVLPVPCAPPQCYSTSGQIEYERLAPVCQESRQPEEIVHVPKKRQRVPEEIGHVPKKRRVSFDRTVNVTCHEATAEELNASWYRRDELNTIKHDSKLCIAAYRNVGCKASRLPAAKYCIRGLENALSGSAAMATRCRKKEATDAVFKAQKDGAGPDQIRMVSEIYSKQTVQDSIKMAAKDARIWVQEFRALHR